MHALTDNPKTECLQCQIFRKGIKLAFLGYPQFAMCIV